jgi:hypothetical protein
MIPGGATTFSFPKAHRLTLRQTQPPVHPYTSGISFIKVKKPGSEADHLLPPAAEVMTVWSYTSTPPYAFTVVCLIQQEDNLTLSPASHNGGFRVFTVLEYDGPLC